MNRITFAALLAGACLVVVAAVASAAPSSSGEHELTPYRAISKQYHDPAAAVADGFLATEHCDEHPTLGAMGYHYFNPERIDDRLVPGRPEVILYKPGPGGEPVLAGVEYVVVDADQDLSTDGDRPSLRGRAFQGPMPGHVPGMPVHYDLHIWAWERNPAGDFVSWNTGFSC